jgi:hypothetical protein
MIDINLHQHVLEDAYFTVKSGSSVDEAIISAIQSAACRPTSPWARILQQPDVTKSDIYKCAIELAATARLRTDKSVQTARFWRNVARCDPRNHDIITPSPSTLEDMDKERNPEERGNMLDTLLDRLRAGEDIRTKKEEEWRPLVIGLNTPDDTPKSPALAFFQFYRAGILKATPLSRASLSSWNSDFIPTLASSKLQEDLVSYQAVRPIQADAPSGSLERICGVFSTSSLASSLDHSSTFGCSFPSLNHVFRPISSFATGRGRSATVPFSARDLALPPVKNVISNLPIVTTPGDKEQKAQAQAGQRVRFNGGALLVRSKAITARRARNTVPGHAVSPLSKATFSASVLREPSAVNSNRDRPPSQNNASLPTPPAEMDSIRYVRPPTVTRKKGSGPQLLDITPIATPPCVSNRPSLDSVPSSPSQQRIRHYVIQDPGTRLSRHGPPIPKTSQSSDTVNRTSSHAPMTASQEQLNHRGKKQPNSPLKSIRESESESNKENIPPEPLPSNPTTPTRTLSGSSRIPIRTPPKAENSHTPSIRPSSRSPPRPAMIKSVIFKPVQPLRIVKKNPVKKHAVSSIAPATPTSPLRNRQRASLTFKGPSTLPR